MAHQLPSLPYAFDALEPHIDAKTMEIHHDKHHAAYVSKLNGALEAHPDLMSKSIESLLGDLGAVPESIRMAVRNNGEVWVVNHLSDSVSIVADGGTSDLRVTRTLLVGDEPRDIVFAGPGGNPVTAAATLMEP